MYLKAIIKKFFRKSIKKDRQDALLIIGKASLSTLGHGDWGYEGKNWLAWTGHPRSKASKNQ